VLLIQVVVVVVVVLSRVYRFEVVEEMFDPPEKKNAE
jgi:hypothetical protein